MPPPAAAAAATAPAAPPQELLPRRRQYVEAEVVAEGAQGAGAGRSAGVAGLGVGPRQAAGYGAPATAQAAPSDVVLQLRTAGGVARGGAGRVDDREDSEGSDEEAGEEEESESEDEETAAAAATEPLRKLFRPVFRPKAARDTIADEAAVAAEAAAAEAAAAAEKTARVAEAKQLIASELRREDDEAAAAAAAAEATEMAGKPDDSDRPEEDEAEFSAWRLREMRRIARDVEASSAAAAEAAETARRRGLTDAERAAEDAALAAAGLKVFAKDKRSWGFLQKYHHRGAFYMDEDSVAKTGAGAPAAGAGAAAGASSAAAASSAGGGVDVRLRAAEGPTEGDVMNRAALPRVMQVRDFGRKGRTKWTHLVAEDTLQYDDYHKQAGRYATAKFGERMAGVHHGGGLGGGGGGGGSYGGHGGSSRSAVGGDRGDREGEPSAAKRPRV